MRAFELFGVAFMAAVRPQGRVRTTASPIRVAMSSDGEEWTRLRALAERVRVLQSTETEYLLGFLNPAKGAFSVEPRSVNRVSVISSSNVIEAMLLNEEDWDKVVGTELRPARLLSATLNATWTFDRLQTPLALGSAVALNGMVPDHPKVRCAIALCCLTLTASALNGTAALPRCNAMLAKNAAILKADVPHPWASAAGQSSYLCFRQAHALCTVLRQGPPLDLPTEEISVALALAGRDAYAVVCEQLSLDAAGIECDPLSLGFALCTWVEVSQLLELRGSSVSNLNRQLVAHGLSVVFQGQLASGLWPKGPPIVQVAQGTSERSRDLGNSFIFAYDLLGALLKTIGGTTPILFRDHLSSLDAAVCWAEENIVLTPGTCAFYASDAAGRGPADVTRGWRSNHLESGGPLCWSTAQVASAMSAMRLVLRRISQDDVLREFHGMRIVESSSRLFDSLMDSDLYLGGQPVSLKAVLQSSLLDPLSCKRPKPFAARPPPAKYSAILYGPPGTAKTTVCESIARCGGPCTAPSARGGVTSSAPPLPRQVSRLAAGRLGNRRLSPRRPAAHRLAHEPHLRPPPRARGLRGAVGRAGGALHGADGPHLDHGVEAAHHGHAHAAQRPAEARAVLLLPGHQPRHEPGLRHQTPGAL